MLSLLEPSYYPGDPVIAATSHAPTFFWRAFAGLGKLAGVRLAAILLWSGARLAAGYATWKTARLLGAGRGAAVLALCLVLLSRHLFLASLLAGDPLFKADLDQTSFTWPLALCAVAAWLGGWRRSAAGGLGLAANLNPLVAGLVFAWLALAELLADRSRLRELGSGALCFAAGALPILFRFLAHPPAGDAALMADCAPLTYLAWRWPGERWVEAGAGLSLVAAAFWKHPETGRLRPLLISALLLWAFQAVVAPLFPPLLTLQFFRLDVVLVWLGAIAVATLLWPRLADGSSGGDLSAAAAFWGAACASISPPLALWTAALLSRGRPQAGLLSAGAGIGAAGALVPTAWFPLHLPASTAIVTLLIAAGAALAAHLSQDLRLHVSGTRPALPVLLAFALLPMAGAVSGNLRDAVQACRDRVPEPFDLWVRTTPKDSVFAAHPASSGLRLRSRRRVYAEWSDFAVALWDRREAAAWKARMESLGLNWEEFRERHAAQERAWDRAYLRRQPSPEASDFPAWSAQDARRLSGVGGSSFLVLPRSLDLPGEPAFQDGSFSVRRTTP